MKVCLESMKKKIMYLVETLNHGNMLGNLIIKDYSENANSYRVPFSSVPVWTVENGRGRWGTVGDCGGLWGMVWGGGVRKWTVRGTGTDEKGTR